MKKRLIFCGRYQIIEPLGILYLLGIAKQLDWETKVVLIKEFDFTPLFEAASSFKPDLVCFTIWTGYHLQAFAACKKLQAMGIPVAIGGPHATFSTESCLSYGNWVCKGDGFRTFRLLLEGNIKRGIYFNPERDEPFPQPDREVVYDTYPELGKNPIKSIICSTGCPFKCSYCYAPHRNEMIGGFRLELRPIDDIIAEALWVKERYPVEMFYIQDDIFGYDITWLKEFAQRWPHEVKIPFHCQIRLEMTRSPQRLPLFREAGCSGITLAIESGNDFLRHFVLLRPMADELIVEGVQKIQELGFTLRTEQILAVPFSDIETDLETLNLNNRLNPTMAWTSILAPYGGTNMGTIATRFGFFLGTNDDLSDTFFDRSILRHVKGGCKEIGPIVRRTMKNREDNPLLRAKVIPQNNRYADVFLENPDIVTIGGSVKKPSFTLEYLEGAVSDRYCDQTAVLQRVFNWLAKIPGGHKLGAQFVELAGQDWTWQKLGELTENHLRSEGYSEKMAGWKHKLAENLGCQQNQLPKGIRENPYYFCFFPSGHILAQRLLAERVFDLSDPQLFDILGNAGRHHLFDYGLYCVKNSDPPIAQR